jgi:hypothetical protein
MQVATVANHPWQVTCALCRLLFGPTLLLVHGLVRRLYCKLAVAFDVKSRPAVLGHAVGRGSRIQVSGPKPLHLGICLDPNVLKGSCCPVELPKLL